MPPTTFTAGILEKELVFFFEMHNDIMQYIDEQRKEPKITVTMAKNSCALLENLYVKALELCSAAEKFIACGYEIKKIDKLRLIVQTYGCMVPSIDQLRANIYAIENGATKSLGDVMADLHTF